MPGASACSTCSTAWAASAEGGVKYDAVVFDLLTALLDSWTLWNDVAGSPEARLAMAPALSRDHLRLRRLSGPMKTLVRVAAARCRPSRKAWASGWSGAGTSCSHGPRRAAFCERCRCRWPWRPTARSGWATRRPTASASPFKVVVTAESVRLLQAATRAVPRGAGGAWHGARSGRCSSPDRPRTCRAPRLSACRSIGTIRIGLRAARRCAGPSILKPIARQARRSVSSRDAGYGAGRKKGRKERGRASNSSPRTIASDRRTGSRI